MTIYGQSTKRRGPRPLIWIIIGVVAVLFVVGGGVGLALFQPWKLIVNDQVNEAAPVTIDTPTGQPSAPVNGGQSPTASPKPQDRIVAQGEFISHEHTTSGSVKIFELADGKRILRLENLNTSNGPDLKVWITDAPVKEGTDGWFLFDDGEYVELGALKGNKGSQNYDIPASVDLSKLTSVSIWCKRFSVSFGAAELKAL